MLVFNGPLIVLYGTVKIAQIILSIPPIVVGFRIFRIECNDPIVIRYGTVKIAQIRLSIPSIKVGFQIVRIEFDCLVVVRHSTFNIVSLQSLATLSQIVLCLPISQRQEFIATM